jgi:hypothetical protein
VIASWRNHWDLKEGNGRRFLRHYWLDFGSALGGAHRPLDYYNGREYTRDGGSILKEIATLGYYYSPNERQGRLISPAIGIFSNEGFSADGWKSHFPLIAFSNMTDEDAFWASRILLAFTKADLQAIIETARYSRSSDAEYLLETLLERRNMIVAHWLSKATPIADFAAELSAEGGSLGFTNLLVAHGLGNAPAEYRYEVRSGRAIVAGSTPEPSIPIDSAMLHGTCIDVSISAVHPGSSRPVTVRLVHDAAPPRLRVVSISRG